MNSDVIIIGGGIVGLSTALKLAEKGRHLKITLLEKEKDVSLHQTGNNSGVIHSGIYYRPGSLKATNCLQGFDKLIRFADENEIPYELCGKLIVATHKRELPRLEDLYKRGIANGLDKIHRIGPSEVKDYEPHVNAIEAIHLPYTGIIDYRAVSVKIKEIIESKYGVKVDLNQEVKALNKHSDEEILVLTQKEEYRTKFVINTSGLFADRIARLTHSKVPYRIIPFRGEYYKIRPERTHLVKNLVYPVPDPEFPFLGVHFTRNIHGEVEAGPNAVFSFKREGYRKTSFSITDTWSSLSWPGFQKVIWGHLGMGLGEIYRSFSKSAFTQALQRLIPEIQKKDLVSGGAGVRAQACDIRGKLIDDFLFLEDRNFLHVLNAPSPAATASFSIGEHIADKAIQRFSKS